MSKSLQTADPSQALARRQSVLPAIDAPDELDLEPLEGMARWLGRLLHPIAFRMVSMVEQPRRNMSGPITPNDGYFRRDRHRHPKVDADNYRLHVTGVAKPRVLTLSDLEALPFDDRVLVMECAGNGNHVMGSAGLVGQAHWQGPSLQTVLDACGGLDEKTSHFVFRGLDPIPLIRRGYHYGLSVDEVNRARALVAVRMNGEPLPRGRGYPARLVVPGIYSMSHVKWLGAIEGLTQAHRGIHNTWVFVNKVRKNGKWVKEQARWIGLKSMVTRCRRTASGWKLTGWAWGGDRPITQVKVSTDGGDSWVEAEVHRPREYFGEKMTDEAFERAWAVFDYEWTDAESGHYRVASRAFDEQGNAQLLEEDPNVEGHFNQTRVKWRGIQVP